MDMMAIRRRVMTQSKRESSGKNLLNALNSNIIIYNSAYDNFTFDDATGVMSFSGNTLCGFIVPVQPNTEYTYSIKVSSNASNASFRMRVREFTGFPASFADSNTYIGQTVDYSASTVGTRSTTWTTGSTTTYILACIYRSGATDRTVSEFQVELGDTATPYEPYVG